MDLAEEGATTVPKSPNVIDFGDVAGSLGKVNTFLSTVQTNEWVQQHRRRVKGWSEFFSTKKFALPRTPATASRRFFRNIDYFRTNYVFVFVILLVYCVLTSPLLLIGFALFGYALYFISNRNSQQPFTFRGRRITIRAQYFILGVVSIPFWWFIGLTDAIFWIIGASILVVIMHAVTYKTDQEIEDDQLIEFPTMQTV